MVACKLNLANLRDIQFGWFFTIEIKLPYMSHTIKN